MSTENNNSLDKEKQEKALKWLNEKWKNQMHCEVCGQKNWSIQTDTVTPIVLKEGGLQIGGISYPQIMVICANCANTKYFNAAMMGLVESKKKDGGEDGK